MVRRTMPHDVALLGYGRFGKALGQLLQECGFSLRIFDPVACLPEDLAAESVATACVGATFVVLAMPVAAFGATLTELQAVLTSEHIVFDVGSVKQTPLGVLDGALGDRVPFVGTHPLFGPMSLALGERPRRVVVCPSARHPAAAQRVSDLFVTLGCEVLEQSAEAHDQVMAETHALAFFIAKGLLDVGAAEHTPYVPPSFYAMARTVDAVRADAGQLFLTIERDNRFALAARKRLLDALTAVDLALRLPAGSDLAVSEHLTIAEGAQPPPELRETRDLIDDLDHELLRLLARRTLLARRAARTKETHGRALVDPLREAALLRQRREWAREAGLAEEHIETIFQAVIQFSRHMQASPGANASGSTTPAPRAVAPRPFRVLGLQQVALGALDRTVLEHLWVELLGVPVVGAYRSEAENVDERLLRLGTGPSSVEIDLMQPIDPSGRPNVHTPALHHLGLWIDDLPSAVAWLGAHGVRFAPGGIRRGGAGYDVCFIHPKGDLSFPQGGAGVLIELVQAPPEVVAWLGDKKPDIG